MTLLTFCGRTNIAAAQGEAFQQSLADLNVKCAEIYRDSSLDPIRKKVAIGSLKDQTFEMRTNTEYPTAEEKRAIVIWGKDRDSCFRAGATFLAMLPAEVAAVMCAYYEVIDSFIAELYHGRITYGELAAHRSRNADEMQTAVADIKQALRSQDQQAHFQAQHIANETIANWASLIQVQAVEQMRSQKLQSEQQ
jgi:hypothetical protein